jgi:hypothetical protein
MAAGVAVMYYYGRNLQPGQTANWPSDYWVENSTNGGATGAANSTSQAHSTVDSSGGAGFFPGDYGALQPWLAAWNELRRYGRVLASRAPGGVRDDTRAAPYS